MQKQDVNRQSKFSPYASVLSEGFTAEDATPPRMPMSKMAKVKNPKNILYKAYQK
ncbi:hypothetical protein [Sporosarcina aquimarina]|uniref:hypothetical protein n=1 Tax=Sporosarcina aquimarina TaxID=114975 RepID=UPI001C8DA8B4|nr:hypothetical protein [Sporosarcina aquimarina]MBY0224103.1 hypothetical protein [Sporosarcina aquimarina]